MQPYWPSLDAVVLVVVDEVSVVFNWVSFGTLWVFVFGFCSNQFKCLTKVRHWRLTKTLQCLLSLFQLWILGVELRKLSLVLIGARDWESVGEVLDKGKPLDRVSKQN